MSKLRVRGALACVAVAVAVALAGAGCGGDDEGTAQTPSGGAGAGNVAASERYALLKYKWYLEVEVESLENRAKKMQERIAAGDYFGAQFKYLSSRISYDHVLPIGRLFEDLALRIDALEDEAPAGEWTGLHRIEKTLFGAETAKGLSGAARTLIEDVRQLTREIKIVKLEPLMVAESTAELMQEASTKWMDGKIEPYARKDLADISAAQEAAERAFEGVRPLLAESDPELVAGIEAKFVETYERLSEHGGPAQEFPTRKKGNGWNFTSYIYLDKREYKEVSTPLRELTKLLGEVPERLPPPEGS